MKDVESWKLLRFKSHYYFALLFLTASTAAVFYVRSGDNADQILEDQTTSTYNVDEDGVPRSCDLFSGQWVFDNVSYPLYEEGRCSFITRFDFSKDEYACRFNGRKDVGYRNWRWQPHRCDLPSFNGTAFLEKIRGKRVVFVGDSLIRNQWTSLLCLIESSLHPSSDKSLIFTGNLAIFNASEYNATIENYWSPLLIESNCDNMFNHSTRNRTIKVQSIEKHARQWNDADILVFDTFKWWLEPTMTIIWGSFGSSDAIYKRVGMKLRRYEMALNTWSDWLEININRHKTKVFFMSLSPFHSKNQSCYNETEPFEKEAYRGNTTDQEMMRIVESVIEKLETRGLKVEYMNITHLSDYRKDGHPSIYRKFNNPPTEEQLANPKSYADCVHWCLPGVPDTWNQILYSYIINS